MTSIELIGIAALGITSGLMIGCIGIGGVILVPALVFLVGIPIKIGIPAAMLAYIVSGLVASFVFARNKSIRWGLATWLCAGATPTAFAGAWAVSVVNPRVLEVGLGLLTFFSGVNSLRVRQTADEFGERGVSSTTLLGVGAVTGFLSSVSGTGGPLVLVPILIAMRLPVLTAVGLSQVIQLPVAIASTVGNVLYGELDLVLAVILAASLTVGSWYGAKLAHILPRETLRRIVAAVLVVIGLFILGNIALRLVR
ncbi:MAG TPA: sulfite exporter TauE/SafE family protein [Pseudolabrys sp.]|nr:sulfite exporter TauE/SafE family protein [Pseudolabrys sp.]